MREQISERTEIYEERNCVCVCVCVCEKERERERERERETDGAEWDRWNTVFFFQCLCGVIVSRQNSEGGFQPSVKLTKQSPLLI